MQNAQILAVVGPTASGKSALAVALAKRLGGEVLSCDSMQIYMGMPIGTAQPTEIEMENIPHHLLHFLPPDIPFSCADYVPLARKTADAVLERGNLPIFCGGTGLYLDSMLRQCDLAQIPTDEALRTHLMQCSSEELMAELREVDAREAEKIHPNNRKRLVRAVEIYRLTKIPKSEWDARSQAEPPYYRALVVGLDYADRQVLYRRIDQRVDRMMEAGLLEEVRALHLPENSTAVQAIGYKELATYLRGKTTLSDACALIKQRSRNYAKRQLTWFSHHKEVHFFSLSEQDTVTTVCNRVMRWLSEQTDFPAIASRAQAVFANPSSQSTTSQ